MDPMTDEDATPLDGAPALAGAMRVVMLNARTAVLVPADAPDPIDAPDPGDASDPVATDDDVPTWDAPTDVAADPEPDDSAFGSMDDSANTSTSYPAWAADTAGADADGSDTPAETSEADADMLSAAGPADAPADSSDTRWRAELLARLDDLGRLLARGAATEPPAGEGLARLTATLDRLDQRLTTAVADLSARIDVLEQAATGAPAADADASADMAEAIADLRMQLRMVEVQVGTLGKLLVSGGPDEATGPDALRTRLAELMAREQRLATGA